MRNPIKSKMVIIISFILFLTSVAAKMNYIHITSKTYKNRNAETIINNTMSKDEKKKVIELINTINEAIACFDNDNISNEVKKQLIKDIIVSVNVVNKKLNIGADTLINELQKQSNNLGNNNKNLETLLQFYNEWKEKASSATVTWEK